MKKFIVAGKSETNETENSVVGWASTPKMDRDKELILSSAWKLQNYQKNPIIMVAHDYSSLPVGKCLWIKSTDAGLKFKAKFSNSDRGREVYQLFAEGILNSFSVGFSPNKGGVIDNPTDVKWKGCKRVFTDVELLEISCVAIPANSEALVDQSSFADQSTFVKYVKSGKIVCKQLKDELEAIVEIIEKDESPIETKDNEINIEMKDEEVIETKETNEIVTKVETTDNFVHVPAPGEEGKHKDCKIRTISISKKDGIRANYCADDKTITSYIFDKKKFDEKTAIKWVKDHKKSFEIESIDKEKDLVVFKCLEWDEDGDVKFEVGVPIIKETDEVDTKELEDVITKAKVVIKPDEKEVDFMTRCMGAMSPKLPEALRQRSCEMIWSKKDVTVEEVKEEATEEVKETTPDEVKVMTPTDTEELDAFMTRCMVDVKMMASNPEEVDRTSACQVIWDEANPPVEKKDEIVEEIKLSDDEIVKSLQNKLTELKTSVEKMHPMAAETEPQMSMNAVQKTADSKGNPSLYDLTSAIGMALNSPKNNAIINPEGELGTYCSVVDIYATEYPNGHIVYSKYEMKGFCEYYQINYTFDIAEREATLVGPPVEVLQAWVEDRYGEQETQMKEVSDIMTKSGRVLSDANRQLLMDCMTQMQEAISAVNALVIATNTVPPVKNAITVEDLFKNEVVDEIKEIVKEAVEKKVEEVDTKSPDELEIDDIVELDIETKSVETFEVEDDEEIDLDENVIKTAIANAMAKVAKGIDVKGLVGEAVARRLGKAVWDK